MLFSPFVNFWTLPSALFPTSETNLPTADAADDAPDAIEPNASFALNAVFPNSLSSALMSCDCFAASNSAVGLKPAPGSILNAGRSDASFNASAYLFTLSAAASA